MPILFEINHPAHIHLFRNLAGALEKKGIDTEFLVKSDPVIEHLAGFYGLSFIKMGAKGKGLWMKYMLQLRFLLKTILRVKKTKATLGLGVSMTLPLVSKFTKMYSIGFDDDDVAATPVFAKFANRANVILTPSALAFEKRGDNHFTYPGYHELAYLHPNRFTPDPSVWEILNLKPGTPFYILRFNSFNAHHDQGEQGMRFAQKMELIDKLSAKGPLFISTESKMEQALEVYKLKCTPEQMHAVLAFATLYVGESQTMTSEAAVLGTPAIKCNTFAGRLSIPNELEEQYGLCYSFLPDNFEKMMAKIDTLLGMTDLKAEWQKRRQRMLKDKIDVTAFLVWFVENYPASVETLKREPDYAYNFL